MFLHKDSMTEKQLEHAMLLRGYKVREVIVVVRKTTSRKTKHVSLFIPNSLGQVIDVTWSFACIFRLDMARIDGKNVIQVAHIDTMMRDLAEFLYNDWNGIRAVVLE